MAGRAVRSTKTEIDPMFFIPEGLEELSYTQDSVSTTILDDDFIDEGFDDMSDSIDSSDNGTSDDDGDYADSPETPQVNSVYQQTIKTDASGIDLVDVVFDVSEVAGATSYEIRVAKI